MATPNSSEAREVFAHYVLETFNRRPHPFQVDVATHLLAGENVVALAPTGSGKTLAPVAAFTYARQQGLQFADRLLYALPQRTLAGSLHNTVAADLRQVAPELRVTIQTGNIPDDPFFEGDVVFTTIDQLLSAYIEVPVSLPPRLANLPAGSLLGALIVFDEFHLLEPGRALATALDLARQLKPYSHTLLMSATFPSSALGEVVRQAGAQLVQVTSDDLDSIPSQRGKRRTYQWHPEPITAEAVLDAHQEGARGSKNPHRYRSIAVVNRVDGAQELYDQVRAGTIERSMDVRVMLLHSRFLRTDRENRESDAIERFKRDGPGGAILVATSVVEVGLDVSCDVLHTEVTMASALFQRAGRCARFEGETGTVHVYDLERTEKGKRRYGPYREDGAIVDAVAEQVEQRSCTTMAFPTEREVVDLTHGNVELGRLGEVLDKRRGQIADAQLSHEPSAVRRLIRESDSVNVFIHSDPARLDLATRPETFSLPRIVLRGLLSQLDLAGDHAGKVQYPEFPNAEGYGQRPEWKRVTRPGEADNHFFLALHPSLASYDRERGLCLLPSQAGVYESRPTSAADTRIERLSYRKEYYADHVARTVKQMELLLSAHRLAAGRIATRMRLRPEVVHKLARFAAGAHDTGKLSMGVQDAMWRWMAEIHGDHRDGFLAHTTFDATDRAQGAMERESRFRRPPHALEGAYAAWPALVAVLRKMDAPRDIGPQVADAVFSAIARHHSASASKMGTFDLTPGATEEAMAALGEVGMDVKLKDKPSPADQAQVARMLVGPVTEPVGYPLYLFLVRLLRMADQRATAGKE